MNQSQCAVWKNVSNHKRSQRLSADNEMLTPTHTQTHTLVSCLVRLNSSFYVHVHETCAIYHVCDTLDSSEVKK